MHKSVKIVISDTMCHFGPLNNVHCCLNAQRTTVTCIALCLAYNYFTNMCKNALVL